MPIRTPTLLDAEAPIQVDAKDAQTWPALARALRVDSVRMTSLAGSGHPTSSLSAADLMAVLLAKHLRYDFRNPKDPANDHLIFSKGHASPLLYAMLHAAGAVDDAELSTYRKLGSRLEGHPTPALPWVDVATGSLGQGLPIGVGVALSGKHIEASPYRVWVLCGDSEMAEGSMAEAFEHAAYYGLDNLTAIVDVNRLGQSGETMHGWDLDGYVARAQAYGWRAIAVDGHDLAAIDGAFMDAVSTEGKPSVVFARTEKGHGVKSVANKPGYHGKPLADPDAAIAELGGMHPVRVDVQKPRAWSTRPQETSALELPAYEKGGKEATRAAYGDALVALGKARGDVVALDGEVKNSTYAERFANAFPGRYFEMYIAEQQMVAAAVGLSVRGKKPFASTFAAFLTRAYDFIRMAAVSRANVVLCGSHAGVSIGEDGPSQMGLEDIAMMRAVWGSTVLVPCDANQCARLVVAAAEHDGISYLRTTREKTPVIYDAAEESFTIGGSRVVRTTDDDALTIVGAGITVHEAMTAAEELAKDGIHARVIDCYSVKPIDVDTLTEAARDTGLIVVVEDHFPEGGLGDAVLDALASAQVHARVIKLAVRKLPGSATPAQQLALAGIDASAIATAVRNALAS